jgi:hypothetical protein
MQSSTVLHQGVDARSWLLVEYSTRVMVVPSKGCKLPPRFNNQLLAPTSFSFSLGIFSMCLLEILSIQKFLFILLYASPLRGLFFLRFYSLTFIKFLPL